LVELDPEGTEKARLVMRTYRALRWGSLFALVVCGLCEGCTPGEDPVVPRHPVRQLVVENNENVQSTEAAPEPRLGRGKYGTGKEAVSFSRPAATVSRPIVVAHARPTPPPR
jgi:hypothetical protein